MAQNFPNMMKNTNFQEVQPIPNRINIKRTTSGHIIVKLIKTKDKLKKTLNAVRDGRKKEGKKTNHVQDKQGRLLNSHQRSDDNTMMSLNYQGWGVPGWKQPKILYVAKISFKSRMK